MKSTILLCLAVIALSAPAMAQNQQAAPNFVTVPGVDQLYALQSNNSLLAYATPEGYAALRDLVRQIDGQLDIIRTDVALVEVSPGRLHTLGIETGDSGKLLSAFASGQLAITDRVHLTTREDTPIDTILHTNALTTIPLSVVPREADDGTLTTELLQPNVVPDGIPGGGTVVARLPGASNGSLRLLFITATIVPSASRNSR